MSFIWLYYIIRSRAVWFFTPSNPSITFGGLEGEPKKEMYDQLPLNLYPATLYVHLGDAFDDILEKIKNRQIAFPFVVKPEVGAAGLLFRKIDTIEQLKEYHSKVQMDFIVQEMVHFPMEVSIFYYRMPGEKNGTISGFLHKIPLHVIGDGTASLLQLIRQHPKASKYLKAIGKVHAPNFNTIIPKGEKYALSHAANHNRGAQFINLQDQIDERLHQVFDSISHSVHGWYYGRYDIMCKSIEDLKDGKNYTILEYNGCGAEPNHIYDCGYSLIEAYKEIVKHWNMLCRISKYNAKHGVDYWTFRRGWKLMQESKQHFKTMKRLEEKLSF